MTNYDLYKQKMDQLIELTKKEDQLRDEMDYIWYSLTQEEIDKLKGYAIEKDHSENVLEIFIDNNQ